MNINLIHIGMKKTATTFMQHSWYRDPNYSLSNASSMSYLKEMRQFVAGNQLNKDNMQVGLDTEYKVNQKIILSNEGFSTGYINEPELQKNIPKFISEIAKSLAGFPHENNVLIVVRDPISWIRSVYNQSISEGGWGSAQQFVDNQELAIKHSLDMRYIISTYCKYFRNVQVLPFELFKQDKEKFWLQISERFDLPKVTAKIHSSVNRSLSDEKIFLLSKLNNINSLAVCGVSTAITYNNSQEKLKSLKSAENNKWLYRRFMEHGDDKYIEELKDAFNIEKIPEDYFNFNLSENCVNSIEKNYIDFLEDFIDAEYIELYRKKFDKYKFQFS